jgi:hypothetical protein
MLTLKNRLSLLLLSIAAISASGEVLAAYPYLDDANPTSAYEAALSADPMKQHRFPRVYQHENIGGSSSAALSKYMFIDTHGTNFDQMETVQGSYSSETMLLRHISGREYQSYTTSDPCFVTMGVAFATTGATSQGGPKSAGCAIYAGHWLYKAGTPLTVAVNGSALTLQVADGTKVTPGQYVVIYDAPAASFKNAEHVKVTARSGNTLTVQRGYKSTPVAHGAGSIVAQHVLGQGSDSRLWAFNFSSVSPRDAAGKTFGQFYADWLQKNLLKTHNGETTQADVAGLVFDTDFYFDLTSAAPDTNNDLIRDDGVSLGGVNWLGAGLDEFYARVASRLPNHYILTGVHDARGYASAHGAQMENWLDYGNGDYKPNPQYKHLNSLFSQYLFNMGARERQGALTHNVTKTPTRLYPGAVTPKPTSNAPLRLGLALTLMDDGYFGTHSNLTGDAWWDEYAVDLTPGGNYGRAVAKSDVDGVHQHRGWLGAPLGPFRRQYDEAAFAASRSLLDNGSFDANTSQWTGQSVTVSRVTSGQLEGAGALRASTMSPYQSALYNARVKSESLSLVAGRDYTIAFAARASAYREIGVVLGSESEEITLGPEWRRYVVAFRQSKTQSSTLTFQVGRENSQVWLDSVHVFEGNVNVFRRDFENGIVLANATPVSRTVHLGGTFLRINGTQDPAINNGAAVTSVTLPPHDGLLLVSPEGSGGGDGGGGGGDGGGGGGGGTGGGRIGDYVWNDVDGDGIQDSGEAGMTGVSVQLLTCQDGWLASTTTSTGAYEFAGLAAGSYKIKVIPPTNMTLSPAKQGSSGGLDSNPDPATGMSPCMALSAAQARLGIDAGVTTAGGGDSGGGGGDGDGGGGGGSGSIGDFVWDDKDRDGIQDSGEAGMSGVSVRLLTCQDDYVASTFTTSGGRYVFDQLPAGHYKIKVVPPINARLSPHRQGSSRGYDSNPDPATTKTPCMPMSEGLTRIGIDAGIIR